MKNIIFATENDGFKFKNGNGYLVKKEFGKKLTDILEELRNVSNYDICDNSGKYNILYISLEKPAKELVDMFISVNEKYGTTITMHYNANGKIEDDIRQTVLSSNGLGRKLLSVIIDRPARIETDCNFNIKEYINYLAAKYNVAIIGIDHLPREIKSNIVIEEI